MKRPCLGAGGQPCGALVDAPASRCPAHARASDRARGTTAERGYDYGWRKRSEAAIAAHRAEFGDICPGWGTGVHVASDLVTDHDLGVMCRACNSRKAATFDKARAQAARGVR